MTKNMSRQEILTTVTSKFQLPGFHFWPDAPERFDYLSYSHRHLFYFEIEAIISKDRGIEFIELGEEVREMIESLYPQSSYGIYHLDFGGRSCEQIALEVKEKIEKENERLDPKHQILLKRISVFEDNENGSTVYA